MSKKNGKSVGSKLRTVKRSPPPTSSKTIKNQPPSWKESMSLKRSNSCSKLLQKCQRFFLPKKVPKPSFWTMFGCGGNCFQSSTYPTPQFVFKKPSKDVTWPFDAGVFLLLEKCVYYLYNFLWKKNKYFKTLWWVVSAHLKTISQIGNLPQREVKILKKLKLDTTT